jgi:competence protein ComEA
MPDDGPLDPLPLPRPAAPSGAAEWRDRFDALRRDPRVAVAVLFAIALVAGVYWFRSGTRVAPAATGSGPPSVASVPAAATTTTTGAPAATEVVVHVAGAVAKPGLVTLRGGSRVADAIDAAGGPDPDADLDRLNLAAPLADGQRIAVAVRGQPAPPLDAAASAAATPAGEGTTPGPINLNTATQAELESLPGIGPTLAQAIIEERERAGGFGTVADLRRVPGIGDARFAQVESLVTV